MDEICAEGLSQLEEIPGDFGDPDEIAVAEDEAANVYSRTASALAGVGASELASAFEARAEAGNELAIAYDEGDYSKQELASRNVDRSAAEAEAVANDLGSDSCAQFARGP